MRKSVFIAIFSAVTVSIGGYSSSAYAQGTCNAGASSAQPAAKSNSSRAAATSSQGAQGNIDISEDRRTAPIENQILAYQALKQISEALAAKLLTRIPANSNVLIYDDTSLKNYAFYTLLETLNNDYAALIKNPGEGSDFTLLNMPIAALQSMVELLAPFRSDTKIVGIDLCIPKAALVAQVAGSLTQKKVKVLYPEIYTTDKLSVEKTLEAIRDLSDLKAQANREVKAPKDREKLASLNAQADELLKLLSSSESEVRKNTIASLVSGYRVSQFLSEKNRKGYIFYVTDILANGTQQTKRNLFFSQLRHSGGVALTYMLFNPRGEIEVSDTLYSHSGFVRMNQRVTNAEMKKEE